MPIDFLNTYDFDDISSNFKLMYFYTEVWGRDDNNQKIIQRVRLRVKISERPHNLLPNVFNLAFGPPIGEDSSLSVDDRARLLHVDLDKMFSTILLFAWIYMDENPNHYVGVDGSNDGRAKMYYLLVKNNYNELKQKFQLIATAKYYIRFGRFDKEINDQLSVDELKEELLERIRTKLDIDDLSYMAEMFSPTIESPVADKLPNYFYFKNVASKS